MYEGSYVLVRVNENADTRRVFVAPPGSACSYTTDVLRLSLAAQRQIPLYRHIEIVHSNRDNNKRLIHNREMYIQCIRAPLQSCIKTPRL